MCFLLFFFCFRNVLGSKNADSSEFKDGEILKANSSDFIIDMPEHNNCDMGGTMRLGKRKTFFDKEKKDTSILCMLISVYTYVDQYSVQFYSLKYLFVCLMFSDALYKKDVIEERHRHRYEVNKNYVKVLEESGLHFVGESKRKLIFSEVRIFNVLIVTYITTFLRQGDSKEFNWCAYLNECY